MESKNKSISSYQVLESCNLISVYNYVTLHRYAVGEF